MGASHDIKIYSKEEFVFFIVNFHETDNLSHVAIFSILWIMYSKVFLVTFFNKPRFIIVVSTSSSKTITGGITIPGANPAVSMKHHAQHRPAQLGARTAVIQSPIGVRGQQQPIVRHMSAAPTRTIPVPSVHPRPHTPNM